MLRTFRPRTNHHLGAAAQCGLCVRQYCRATDQAACSAVQQLSVMEVSPAAPQRTRSRCAQAKQALKALNMLVVQFVCRDPSSALRSADATALCHKFPHMSTALALSWRKTTRARRPGTARTPHLNFRVACADGVPRPVPLKARDPGSPWHRSGVHAGDPCPGGASLRPCWLANTNHYYLYS